MNGEPRGSAGYGAEAALLAQRYESITFADVHRDVMHLFPAAPARVLDIGAGSGRDAAAMARLGHRVVAVEPTVALRIEGQRRHDGVAIEWIDDHLPLLATLRAPAVVERRFDLILLTAVWMHLDATEREAGLPAIAALLAPGGQIVMSLRHGPVPPGRTMYAVSAEETIALASAHGLQVQHRSERGDTLGRQDVTWSGLVLCRA